MHKTHSSSTLEFAVLSKCPISTNTFWLPSSRPFRDFSFVKDFQWRQEVPTFFRLAKFNTEAENENGSSKNGYRNWNSVFQCRGKRKMKIEVRIPLFNIVGKRKTKMEAVIPFSYVVGKRLSLKYTRARPSFC